MMMGIPNNRVSRFFGQAENNRIYMLSNKTIESSPQHRLRIILVCWNIFQTVVFDEMLLFPRKFWGPFWKSLAILIIVYHNH